MTQDMRITLIVCVLAVAVSLTTLAIGYFRGPTAAWSFMGGYVLGVGVMLGIVWLALRRPRI